MNSRSKSTTARALLRGAKLLARLGNTFLAQRTRWVLWLPVLMGAGVATYFSLAVEPPVWSGPVLVGGVGGLLFVVRRREVAVIVLGGLLAVVLGFASAQLRTQFSETRMLIGEHGPAGVEGRLLRVEEREKDLRITLDEVRVSGLVAYRTPGKVRITLRGAQPDLRPGQWLRLPAVLTTPPPPSMPGAFDFQRQAFFDGLGAVGYAVGKAEITGEPPVRGMAAIRLALETLREAISATVRDAIGEAPGALAAALMTGERAAIPEPVLQALRDAGLAHLLAISGLHIGLVAGILFVGLRAILALVPPLALNWPIKKWAAGVAALGAFGYAMLAGATVPSLRAFLMIGLVLLAVILDRRGISMRAVAWAAAAILLTQPESLLGPSFQMSFGAVVALIAAYEAVARRRRRGEARFPAWIEKPALYLGGVGLTTVIAGLATAPFAIHHFNTFAAYGLLGNLLAVPVTALWVMPWAVVSFLLMPFGLADYALIPVGWGVEAVIRVAAWVAGLDGAVVVFPALPVGGLVAVALGGLWLCLWRGWMRAAGLPMIAAGMATLLVLRPPDVVIDGGGKLMAVLSANDGYMVSSRQAAPFSRQTWLKRAGYGEDAPTLRWPNQGASPDGRLLCDGLGCVYQAKSWRVALMRDPLAMLEDCRAADLVVGAFAVDGNCGPGVAVIDEEQLRLGGSHAIWLEPQGLRIESVADDRGRRPWVVEAAPSRSQ